MLICLSVIALGACPLPFDFVPKGTTGSATPNNDPANPLVTAAPLLVVNEITNGAPVDSVPDPIVGARNIQVSLESETPGASIFYTTDGSDPAFGSSATKLFIPGSPTIFANHGAGATFKAVAIGPNMYPSLMTTRVVSVSYQQVASPTFGPAPGNFSTNQSVTITTSTPGATIYYTIADGTGGAPTPQPGMSGTFQYVGTPIPVTGTGTAKSINAVAVKSEMLDSNAVPPSTRSVITRSKHHSSLPRAEAPPRTSR